MVWDYLTKKSLALFVNIECAVILCQTFVEPQRRIFHGVVDEKVNVLVKDYAERVVFAVALLCGQGDVVNIWSGLKVACVIPRVERLVGVLALENYDGRRHRRCEIELSKESREHVAELFKPRCDLSNLFFACIADKKEVL